MYVYIHIQIYKYYTYLQIWSYRYTHYIYMLLDLVFVLTDIPSVSWTQAEDLIPGTKTKNLITQGRE